MAVDSWWNNNWTKRKKISSDTLGNAYSSGVHYFRVPLDISSLVSVGKLRNDAYDLRIVFQNDSSQQEIMRYVASGASPNRLYFPAHNDVPSGTNIGDQADYAYYLYYDNPNASNDYPTWSNINCPQAPFSHTCRSTPYISGYYDRTLVRLNDNNPEKRFAEECDGNYVKQPSGYGPLEMGRPGRLDACVFLPSGTADTRVKIDADGSFSSPDWDILEPSGAFIVDMWVKPAVNLNDAQDFFHYMYGKRRSASSISIHSAWPGDKLATKKIRAYNYANQFDINIDLDAENIWKDKWVFYRHVMDRDHGNKDRIWIKGSGVDLYWEQNDGNAPITRSTAGSYKYLNIGNIYENPPTDPEKMFIGEIEQFRYGVGPHFLTAGRDPGGTMDGPDFVDPEYSLSLSAEESGGGTSISSALFILG